MRKVLISFATRKENMDGWNFLSQPNEAVLNKRLTRINFYSSYRRIIGSKSGSNPIKLCAIRDLRDFNPILLRAPLINSLLLCSFFFFFLQFYERQNYIGILKKTTCKYNQLTTIQTTNILLMKQL